MGSWVAGALPLVLPLAVARLPPHLALALPFDFGVATYGVAVFFSAAYSSGAATGTLLMRGFASLLPLGLPRGRFAASGTGAGAASSCRGASGVIGELSGVVGGLSEFSAIALSLALEN